MSVYKLSDHINHIRALRSRCNNSKEKLTFFEHGYLIQYYTFSKCIHAI